MTKYAIAVEDGYALSFFFRNLNGFIVLTKISPTLFPDKKKANRLLKRLNKYHGGDFFVVDYQELTRE